MTDPRRATPRTDTVLAEGYISPADVDMLRVTDDVDEVVATMVARNSGDRSERPTREDG